MVRPAMSALAPNHEHVTVVTHVVGRRQGIPYEIARTVCASCARVLAEKPIKRLPAAV